MAMEKNPPRSKDPEQLDDTVPSYLLDALIEEAEGLIQPEKIIFQQSIDTTKLSASLQEAYNVDIDPNSAYVEVVPFSSSLFIMLNDDSYLQYRLDAPVTESTSRAAVFHFMEYNNGEYAELIDKTPMKTSEFVVFVRALDSLAQDEDSRIQE